MMLSNLFKVLAALPAFLDSCEKVQKWVEKQVNDIRLAEAIKKARTEKDSSSMDSFY